VGTSNHGPTSDQPATLSAEEYAVLSQLASAYCVGVDGADPALLEGLFTDDAEFRAGELVVTGKDDVVAFLVASKRGTHVATAPYVSFSAAGVRMQSRFIFAPANGDPAISGGYEDRCVRTPAGWRFASRAANLQPMVRTA